MTGLPPSQLTGCEIRRRNGQGLVHVAVGLQQVHPGQHAHHVADPERRDQQHQEQPLAAPGEPGHEVGGRVADHQAQQRADGHVDDRPDHDGPGERGGPHQVVPHVDDVGRTPVQRVPDGDRRLEQPVELAHGDGQDGVERHDEQQDQPDHAGRRQGDPEAAPVGWPASDSWPVRPRHRYACCHRVPLDSVAHHEPGLLPECVGVHRQLELADAAPEVGRQDRRGYQALRQHLLLTRRCGVTSVSGCM